MNTGVIFPTTTSSEYSKYTKLVNHGRYVCGTRLARPDFVRAGDEVSWFGTSL